MVDLIISGGHCIAKARFIEIGGDDAVALAVASRRDRIGNMRHRHLNHHDFTLAAMDDIIARGKRADWEELRRAVLSDPSLAAKIKQICVPRIVDRYAQRYHFWWHYVKEPTA